MTSIRGVTVTPDAHIFVASREGAFESADDGATWTHVVTGLPDKDITSILYDGAANGCWPPVCRPVSSFRAATVAAPGNVDRIPGIRSAG